MILWGCMKLLIVGGAGYIGGVTAHLAKAAGHDVTVFDNLSTGRPYNVPKGAAFIHGDVTHHPDVTAVFKQHAFDAVMHFAAKILVPESMKQPYEYFLTNTGGALTVIDEAAQAGVKAYIFSSSAATYGEPASTPVSEDAPTNPVNPYGASKLLTEQLLHSYEITHDLQWVALRYFNVAGAYDGVGTDYPYVSHIIPSLLAKTREHAPIQMYGNDYDTPDGTPIRDYVHVLDIGRAHLLALDKMLAGNKINQPINLSSDHGYSVKQVIDTFKKVTRTDMPVEVKPRRAGDPARLFATNDRAKQLLGWQPEHDLESMIHDHYAWYSQQDHPNAPITSQ